MKIKAYIPNAKGGPKAPLSFVQPTKTHEDRQVADLFDADETIDMSLTTEDDALEEVIYDAIPIDLDAEDTNKLWEETAKKFGKEIRDSVVTSLAYLDAVKGVEEHFTNEISTSLQLIDDSLVKEITKLTSLKLKMIYVDAMGLTEAQKTRIFKDIVNNTKDSASRLIAALKDMDADSPYGMTRKRRESNTHDIKSDSGPW